MPTLDLLKRRVTQKITPAIWRIVGRSLSKTKHFQSCLDPDVEFHTMLGKSELTQYIIGMKSILRFTNDFKIGLVVHSDGSLRKQDLDVLRAHFSGIRYVDPMTASENCIEKFGEQSFPVTQRNVYLSWRRLIDTQLFRQSNKIINIDSDVLCLNPPHELLAWIDTGTSPLVIGQTNGKSNEKRLNGEEWYVIDETDPEKIAQRPVQTRFLKRLEEISRLSNLPCRFLDGGCAGLHCHQQELNLKVVEQVVNSASSLGIPMSEWGAEQCTVVYILSAMGGKRLDPNRSFNYFPTYHDKLSQAELVHFVGLSRYHRFLYPRYAQRISQQLMSD